MSQVLTISPFIIDTLAPTLSWSGSSDIQVIEGTYYIDLGILAYDSVDGDISHSITSSGSLNTLIPGSYTRDYFVSDRA
jgi:Domain of unknown function (DUF5011)